VYAIEKDSLFDTLPIKDNLFSMPNLGFERLYIVTILNTTKCNINHKDQNGVQPRVVDAIQKS